MANTQVTSIGGFFYKCLSVHQLEKILASKISNNWQMFCFNSILSHQVSLHNRQASSFTRYILLLSRHFWLLLVIYSLVLVTSRYFQLLPRSTFQHERHMMLWLIISLAAYDLHWRRGNDIAKSAIRRCSIKELSRKTLQNLQESTCKGVLLSKATGLGLQFFRTVALKNI